MTAKADERHPNILWLVIDDMGADFSCYGEKLIKTPNIDRLRAKEPDLTMLFLRRQSAPPRVLRSLRACIKRPSALITTLVAAASEKIVLPKQVVPIPALFQQAGYTTTNGNYPEKSKNIGKCDYNFEWNPDIYDGGSLRDRNTHQPFFAQLQLWGGKNRHDDRWVREVAPESLGKLTDPSKVALPPYYPRDQLILEDWAQYLDTVRYTDLLVGKIIDQLDAEKLLDDTVIILFADNGISHARGKQFLYDEGIRTPLIIRGPGIESGKVRDDLVEHIDLAATSLALAAVAVPEWMQGDDILATDYKPKQAVYAARDRCGETVDMIRSVRTIKYKYIRNFFPDRPLLQPSNYKDTKQILIRLRELHEAGNLTELQEKLLFSPKRSVEELYDLESDPYETVNLAGMAEHNHTLLDLRSRLKDWMEQTQDPGPESPESYAYEMKFQIDRNQNDPRAKAAIEQNVELMKHWAKERPLQKGS